MYVGEVTGQIETEFSSSYRCLSSPNSLPPQGTSTEAAPLLCTEWKDETGDGGGGGKAREGGYADEPAKSTRQRRPPGCRNYSARSLQVHFSIILSF